MFFGSIAGFFRRNGVYQPLWIQAKIEGGAGIGQDFETDCFFGGVQDDQLSVRYIVCFLYCMERRAMEHTSRGHAATYALEHFGKIPNLA